MSSLGNIRQKYSQLSKSNKKIADYILKSTSEAIGKTALEIGKVANVSAATVVRFAKIMGYSSMEDMKIQLSAELQMNENDGIIDSIISKNDSLDVLCLKAQTLIEDTISDTFELLDKKVVYRAIEIIKQSKTIYLFGIGSSGIPASDLFHKFNRAGYTTFYNQDIHIGLELLANANQTDVIICFSYSGYTREIVLVIEYAYSNQLPVIIVTRNTSEKLSEKVSALIQVPSNEHLLRVGAISSLYSSLSIATILYLGVIQDGIEDNLEQKMRVTKKIINPLKDDKSWE